MATTYPDYIVLAHLPKDPTDPMFGGEFGLHPTEWVIFGGRFGAEQARAKADKYRKYFHEVQVRTVGLDSQGQAR